MKKFNLPAFIKEDAKKFLKRLDEKRREQKQIVLQDVHEELKKENV